MKRFFLFAILFTSPLLFSQATQVSQTIRPNQIQDSLIAVASCRGGSHLFRLVLQHFTKRPLYCINTRPDIPFSLKYKNDLDLILDQNKRPIYYTCIPAKVNKINPSTNQIVLLIRNPKELLISIAKRTITGRHPDMSKGAQIAFITDYMKKNYTSPIAKIKAFERWPEDRRLLIAYEDLISDRQNTIEKLMAFLGEDPAIVKPNLKKFEELQKQSIADYNEAHKRSGGSLSNGSHSVFHSNDLPKEALQAFDQLLQTKYPDLWEKYLSRYATH